MLTSAYLLPRGVHFGGFYIQTATGRALRLWAIDEHGDCIEETLAHTLVELADEMARLSSLLDATPSPDFALTSPTPIQTRMGQLRPRLRVMRG